jgi:hypothetical protein
MKCSVHKSQKPGVDKINVRTGVIVVLGISFLKWFAINSDIYIFFKSMKFKRSHT